MFFSSVNWSQFRFFFPIVNRGWSYWQIIMTTTSQKHTLFVAEPMGDKRVTELAGIGEVLGRRLENRGFDKAYVVLGQFLVLKKNRELFLEWLQDLVACNSNQASECYQCLSDWCCEFLWWLSWQVTDFWLPDLLEGFDSILCTIGSTNSHKYDAQRSFCGNNWVHRLGLCGT